MLSSDQLVLLANLRTATAEQTWAASAREAVAALRINLLATRCSATVRNLTALEEINEVELVPGTVVSRCAVHNTFHIYTEAKARLLATNLAVNVQAKLSTAEAELEANELRDLRHQVVRAQHAFFAQVSADAKAIDDYRNFHIGTKSVSGKPLAFKIAKPVPVINHSPIQARLAQAARVKAEIGITDTQLVQFYRCYRKKQYETVAAAVNATLLVHDAFERMNVYLCSHCTYLHIGHRSQQGDTLTPAFFNRAIEKWHAEPAASARFLASLHQC
jgi:hypothetical protein